MSRPHTALKNLLLSSLLATSMIAPTTLHAETVSVMVVNVRSEDGIYRPALRVLRGGTVTFFRTDDPEAENPLTVRTIYNQAALMTWLMEAIPATAGETFDIQIEQPPQSSSPKEEEPAPTPDENTEPDDDDDLAPCGPSPCGSVIDNPITPYCPPGAPCIGSISSVETDQTMQIPQVLIADMSHEQRLQAYATL
jgi:hypothetical protein